MQEVPWFCPSVLWALLFFVVTFYSRTFVVAFYSKTSSLILSILITTLKKKNEKLKKNITWCRCHKFFDGCSKSKCKTYENEFRMWLIISYIAAASTSPLSQPKKLVCSWPHSPTPFSATPHLINDKLFQVVPSVQVSTLSVYFIYFLLILKNYHYSGFERKTCPDVCPTPHKYGRLEHKILSRNWLALLHHSQ